MSVASQWLRYFGSTHKKIKKPTDYKCVECDSPLGLTEPNVVHKDPPRQRAICSECGLKQWIRTDTKQVVLQVKNED